MAVSTPISFTAITRIGKHRQQELLNDFVQVFDRALKIMAVVLLWKLMTIVAAYLAIPFLPLVRQFTALRDLTYQRFGLALPYGLWVWGNFDGFYYLALAHQGFYHMGQQPFFPFYPMLIRSLSQVTALPLLISGQMISLVSLGATIFILADLLRLDGALRLDRLMVLTILFFPTAFFYGAAYNDALFFFLATLCLYWGRKKQWVAASVAGALATLTRLNGLALWAFLVSEYLLESVTIPVSHYFDWHKWRETIRFVFRSSTLVKERLYIIFSIPLAFLSYLWYLQHIFGRWQVLFTSMRVWHQEKLTLPFQVLWRYLKILLLSSPGHITYWVAVVELVSVAFYSVLLLYSWKKIRLSYWLFFAISLTIPALTGTFQGMLRYGLHLYPMYLALAVWLFPQPKIVKSIYFTICLLLGMWMLALFTRGFFVA